MTPSSYAKRVGERLRAIRRQQNLSLQDVEARSGEEFKASVLGAYERGERAISVPRLQRLAGIYRVPVDRLLPSDDGSAPGVIDLAAEFERAEPGWSTEHVRLDLTRLGDLDGRAREVLERYLHGIQRQRQDYNGRVITIREDDVRLLAAVLDLTPTALRRTLTETGVRLFT